MSFIGFENDSGNEHTRVMIPKGYVNRKRWQPCIGDIFPDFTCPTTQGPLNFHEWAEGSWVFFFSHPAAFTPVCSTEIADVADYAEEFAERNVKLLSIGRDDLYLDGAWLEDIEEDFDVSIDFPLISDVTGELAMACGMIHPKEDEVKTIRKSFIIDPSLRIRMINEYPLGVGRDIEEVLRTVDALQAIAPGGLVTPSGWRPGDPLLISPDVSDEEAERLYGDRIGKVRRYMRVLKP